MLLNPVFAAFFIDILPLLMMLRGGSWGRNQKKHFKAIGIPFSSFPILDFWLEVFSHPFHPVEHAE